MATNKKIESTPLLDVLSLFERWYNRNPYAYTFGKQKFPFEQLRLRVYSIAKKRVGIYTSKRTAREIFFREAYATISFYQHKMTHIQNERSQHISLQKKSVGQYFMLSRSLEEAIGDFRTALLRKKISSKLKGRTSNLQTKVSRLSANSSLKNSLLKVNKTPVVATIRGL